jgi:hypothetical protein
MAALVQDTTFQLSSDASRQVDGALVTLRWIIIFLAWVAATLITGNPIPGEYFLTWLIAYIALNGILAIGVRQKNLPSHLPVLGLAGDMLLLSILPLLPGIDSPLLILFAIFPTLVAAMRYGVVLGAVVAVIVLLPYELSIALE